MIYVDVDVCLVKVEVEWVVMCYGIKVFIVLNGGLRLL